MRAFFEEKAHQNVKVAMKFYDWAIEVLEKGARIWANTPLSEKGAIFTPTFVRGVWKLKLSAYHAVRTAISSDCENIANVFPFS